MNDRRPGVSAGSCRGGRGNSPGIRGEPARLRNGSGPGYFFLMPLNA